MPQAPPLPRQAEWDQAKPTGVLPPPAAPSTAPSRESEWTAAPTVRPAEDTPYIRSLFSKVTGIGPPPSGYAKVESWFPAIGGLIGDVVGTIVEPGGGTILGGTFGAGAGRVLQRVSRAVRGAPMSPPPVQRIGEPAPPPPPPERAVDVASDIATHAFTQGTVPAIIGRGTTRVLGRIAAPEVPAAATEARAVFGEHMTPAQIKSGPVRTIVENVGRGAIGSQHLYTTFDQETMRIAEQKASQILLKSGPATTKAEAGRTLHDAIEAAEEAAHQAASVQYKKLFTDKRTLAIQVPTQPIQDAAIHLAEQEGPEALAIRGGAAQKLTKVLPTTGVTEEMAAAEVASPVTQMAKFFGIPKATLETDPMYQKVMTQLVDQEGVTVDTLANPTISFEKAHRLRSAIGQIVGRAERKGDTYTYGVASQLYKTLTETMETAAGGPNSLTMTVYTAANAAWKQKAETFEEGILASLVKQRPTNVVKALFGSNDPAAILEARKTLPPQAFGPAQQVLAQSILVGRRTGADPRAWELASGKDILARLSKYDPKTIDAALPGVAADLWKLGRALEYVQRPQSGIGKLAIQFTQAGPVIGVLVGQPGRITKAATAIAGVTMTPYLLSKVMLSTPMRKLLLGALDAQLSGKAILATQITGELVAALVRSGIVLGTDLGTPTMPPAKAQGAGLNVGATGAGGRSGGPPPPPPASLTLR